ncbi:MAG: polysaccharide pyruvyl transferase family protein, partial [Bacteroidales bacterium]|nr:polysaccharide pyruvyl transferase family protein [Bacteroidales bacterium]
QQMKSFAASCIYFCLGKSPWKAIHWPYNTRARNRKAIIDEFSKGFTCRYIQRSPSLDTLEQLQAYCDSQRFDAYVVGSDQVWRPMYNSDIDWMFLSFLPKECKAKRIAYAASFGTDQWEFKPALTAKVAPLAQRFDVVTVREDAGVDLCKTHLGVEAHHVLDPTMLLSADHYLRIAEERLGPCVPQHKLFAYILDKSPVKADIVEAVATGMRLEVETMSCEFKLSPYMAEEEAVRQMPAGVDQWLRHIAESQFVVTDSFHGVAFSIILNRPFVVYGNKKRGVSRVSSLLKIYGLEDRLVQSPSEATDIMSRPIPWPQVNATRSRWAERSQGWLPTKLE